MTFQDILAVGALAVGVVATPSAWLTYRASRRQRNSAKFATMLASLRIEQNALTDATLSTSPDEWRIEGLRMLTKPEWIPPAPIALNTVQLELQSRLGSDTQVVSAKSRASGVLRSVGLASAQSSYSSAMTTIGGVKGLFNGIIYRLLTVDFSLQNPRMIFAKGHYFEYLDTCEILAFESYLNTARRPTQRSSYRRSLRNPFDFCNRVASLGIDTLTIRQDESGAGFFLHERDPGRVVNNSSLIGVIPAGEFTPSDVTQEAFEAGLNLWRNIMREFAEEFLGVEDAQGRGGVWIDYEEEAPYKELNVAMRNGRLKVYILGLGLDPLVWKPELLTVCVIEGEVFDEIFSSIVKENDEGLILAGRRTHGLPFNASTVERYCAAPNISPNAHACLKLAWKHRAKLGL